MNPKPEPPIQPAEIARILASPLPTYRRAAVIATTGEGRVLHWNAGAERLRGWKSRDVISRSILDLAPGDTAAEILAILQGGQPWAGEILLRRRNGLPHRAYVMIFPLGDLAHGRGVIVGVSVAAAQRQQIARDAARIEAELHRRVHGAHLVRIPISKLATSDSRLRALQKTRADVRRYHAPIGPIRKLEALHAKHPRTSDSWRLMQRIETYRYRAEGLDSDRRSIGSGRARLAQMWLSLADRLHSLSRK